MPAGVLQSPSTAPVPAAALPKEPSRVLIVEPHPTLRTVLVQRLRQDGHLTAAVGTAAEALEVCQEQFLICL